MDRLIEMVNSHADMVTMREQAVIRMEEKRRRREVVKRKFRRIMGSAFCGVPVISNGDFRAAVGMVCVTVLLGWILWLTI